MKHTKLFVVMAAVIVILGSILGLGSLPILLSVAMAALVLKIPDIISPLVHIGGKKMLKKYLLEQDIDPATLPAALLTRCESTCHELAQSSAEHGDKKVFAQEYDKFLKSAAYQMGYLLKDGKGYPQTQEDFAKMRDLLEEYDLLPNRGD